MKKNSEFRIQNSESIGDVNTTRGNTKCAKAKTNRTGITRRINKVSQRKSQTRIVLTRELIPIADQILQETGIGTYSQLMAILLKAYGDRLLNSLKQ